MTESNISLPCPANNGTETIQVEETHANQFRVKTSPAFIKGLVKGDEFALDPKSANGFVVLRRSGNVCVQCFIYDMVEAIRDQFVILTQDLHGSIDTFTVSKSGAIASLSIPVSQGLIKIERSLMALETKFPKYEWFLGNIYENDSNKPLNWWGEPYRTNVDLISRVKPSGEQVLDHVTCETTDMVYRVVRSPALVQGLAADDEIQVDNRNHIYQILRHGRNVAVHFFTKHDAEACRLSILPEVGELGGWLDGFFCAPIGGELVFTIPQSVGFSRIDQLFDAAVKSERDSSWKYYNVYEPHTGKPLNWW
jgi:hypothetical protein